MCRRTVMGSIATYIWYKTNHNYHKVLSNIVCTVFTWLHTLSSRRT